MKQIIVKLFFVLFIFIFSAEKVWAADTSTSDISYYFSLESRGFSGDSSVVEPEDPTENCSLNAGDCYGATPIFDAVNCACICDKTAKDCLGDEVFNQLQCRCEKCPNGQIVINGICTCPPCEQENYISDAGSCSCRCGLTDSSCERGKSYLVDDANGCRCVACPTLADMDLTCPISNGVDANGCLQYREKTSADCAAGEVLKGCECVQETISCAENYVLINGECVCGLVCEKTGMIPDESCSSCVCENGGQWARVDAYQPVQYTYTCCPSDRVVSENGELICCDETYTDGGVKKCLREYCAILDNYGDEVGSFPCDGTCIYDGDLTFFCCPLGTDTSQGHC